MGLDQFANARRHQLILATLRSSIKVDWKTLLHVQLLWEKSCLKKKHNECRKDQVQPDFGHLWALHSIWGILYFTWILWSNPTWLLWSNPSCFTQYHGDSCSCTPPVLLWGKPHFPTIFLEYLFFPLSPIKRFHQSFPSTLLLSGWVSRTWIPGGKSPGKHFRISREAHHVETGETLWPDFFPCSFLEPRTVSSKHGRNQKKGRRKVVWYEKRREHNLWGRLPWAPSLFISDRPQSTQYWTVFTFHTILNSPLHTVFTRRALQYSIYRREGIAVQYLTGERAWAIFPGMRCEASPASPYVNTVRADSAFMIKNANLAFHDPQKFNTKMCDMISQSLRL